MNRRLCMELSYASRYCAPTRVFSSMVLEHPVLEGMATATPDRAGRRTSATVSRAFLAILAIGMVRAGIRVVIVIGLLAVIMAVLGIIAAGRVPAAAFRAATLIFRTLLAVGMVGAGIGVVFGMLVVRVGVLGIIVAVFGIIAAVDQMPAAA
jgi:hypothetical protein